MSNSTSIIQNEVRQEILAEDAYKRVLPELQAIAADDLLQVSVDPTAATAIALGARPRLLAMRKQLQENLPGFPAGMVDKIEDYAYALLYAHSVHQAATDPDDALPTLLAQADEMVGRLELDAKALAARGIIDPDSLDALTRQTGYKNRASDLQLLVTVLNGNWARIEGKVGTDRAELELASRLAGRIVRLMGQRDHSPAAIADASDKRARAFTLFSKGWDELRRGVAYVRWHEGDAEEFAPSLYANRGKSRDTEPAQPKTPPPQPQSPAPGQPANGPVPVQRNLEGIPGGSPFIA